MLHQAFCITFAAVALVADASVPTRLDLALLREVTPDRGHNQAVSPFLVSNVLSQLWLGAGGTTRQQIGSTLGVTSQQDLTGYTSARSALSRSSVTTAIFNRLYLRDGFSVKPSFPNIIRQIYGTDVQKFSDIPSAVQTINADVSKVTRNRIKKLVTEDVLKHAQLVIVGALYFKAAWETPFISDPPQSFLTSSGDRRVPMMWLHKRLPYRSFDDYDVVSLPYEDKDYSLLIFRPTERSQSAVDRLHGRLSSIDIPSVYSQVRHSVSDVIVTMPKFKIESSYELKSSLSSLGIQRLFTPQANLSGISDQDLMVSAIVHKVFIEVNEEGTEAAAAVAAIGIATSSNIRLPVQFRVDRPFLAVLYHNEQQLNLFSAWVADPSKATRK